MHKRLMLSCVAVVALITNSTQVFADSLQGEVKQNTTRITRPGQSLTEKTADTNLQSGVSDSAFNLNAEKNGPSAELQGEWPASSPTTLSTGTSETSVSAGTSTTQLNGAAEANSIGAGADKTTVNGGAATSPTGSGSGGTAAPPKYDYNSKSPLSGSVTFRMCYYDLGDGAECAWEALRDANYLQGRGVDIALMLDRGGVRLANRHNTHEYQLHRGSTEHLVQTQQMLKTFIANGGKVFVSERWAKTFGLTGGSYPALTQGVTLLSDEEMCDLLVERSGRIVDY